MEVSRQIYITKRGAAKHLLAAVKKGNEETQWCAARVLVQLAFANEETSKLLVSNAKGPALISTVATQIKKIDTTDRVKETLFQLLNNIATNNWDAHEAIIQEEIISHAIATLKSVRAADSLKRAAVNFIYSLSFSSVGRESLLDNDVVGALIPIVKVNKATLNSMCATLAISNLVGGKQRTPMLAGCAVPEKVFSSEIFFFVLSCFQRFPAPNNMRKSHHHQRESADR